MACYLGNPSTLGIFEDTTFNITLLSTLSDHITTSASSLTISDTIESNCNMLVVVVTWGRNANRSITSITYNGVALTIQVQSPTTVLTSNRSYTAIAYLMNPATGSAHNLITTLDGNADSMDVKIYHLAGVSAVPTFWSNSGNRLGNVSKTYSLDVSNIQEAFIIAGRCISRVSSGPTFTPVSGYTEDFDQLNGGSDAAHYSMHSTILIPAGTNAVACTASAIGSSSQTDSMAVLAIR